MKDAGGGRASWGGRSGCGGAMPARGGLSGRGQDTPRERTHVRKAAAPSVLEHPLPQTSGRIPEAQTEAGDATSGNAPPEEPVAALWVVLLSRIVKDLILRSVPGGRWDRGPFSAPRSWA